MREVSVLPQKSKTNLFLLELTLAMVAFSLCACVCLTIFAKAAKMSETSDRIDNATLAARNIAEIYKAYGGDSDKTADIFSVRPNGGTVTVYYTSQWSETPAKDAFFSLTLENTGENELYKKAHISVKELDSGTSLVEFDVASMK